MTSRIKANEIDALTAGSALTVNAIPTFTKNATFSKNIIASANATISGTTAVTGTLTTAAITSSGIHTVNFNGGATQAFKYTDTAGGNLASFGQFYNTSDGLIANIQNANNDGLWFNLKNGGIVFDQTGYVAGNALDDYEEGTWTATLVGSTTNPSSTVEDTAASYTKIGRQVFCRSQFTNVNTTGAAGGVRVNGLPFAAATSFASGNVMTYVGMTLGTTSTNISPYVSGTSISFYQSTNQAGWGEIAHNASSGTYFAFTVVYDTDS